VLLLIATDNVLTIAESADTCESALLPFPSAVLIRRESALALLDNTLIAAETWLALLDKVVNA
jgi:hypothetical protein